jgi:hypothetical protein
MFFEERLEPANERFDRKSKAAGGLEYGVRRQSVEATALLSGRRCSEVRIGVERAKAVSPLRFATALQMPARSSASCRPFPGASILLTSAATIS